MVEQNSEYWGSRVTEATFAPSKNSNSTWLLSLKTARELAFARHPAPYPSHFPRPDQWWRLRRERRGERPIGAAASTLPLNAFCRRVAVSS